MQIVSGGGDDGFFNLKLEICNLQFAIASYS
jgi:hypothetical protein